MFLGAHVQKCHTCARDSLVPPGGGKYTYFSIRSRTLIMLPWPSPAIPLRIDSSKPRRPRPLSQLFHRAASALLAICSWKSQPHLALWRNTIKRGQHQRDSEYIAKNSTATAEAWGCPEKVKYNWADIVSEVFIFWRKDAVLGAKVEETNE